MQLPQTDLQQRLARIRLVLMDIDGTLVSSDKATFANVVEQLKKLKRRNIRFSIATGRTISGSSAVLAGLRAVGMRMPSMITYNGGVLLSAQDLSLSHRHLIGRADFEALIMFCRARGLKPIAYACDERLDLPPFETAYVESDNSPMAEFNGMTTRSVDDLTAVEDDFVAVLIEAPNVDAAIQMAAEMASTFAGRLRVSTSGGSYVEVCHLEGTKLKAMTRLAKLHNIALDEIMAIGDNLNDLEMIRGAGVGVAVSNSSDAVKAEADIVCSRPSGEGVVQALRMLIGAVRVSEQSGVESSSRWPSATLLP